MRPRARTQLAETRLHAVLGQLQGRETSRSLLAFDTEVPDKTVPVDGDSAPAAPDAPAVPRHNAVLDPKRAGLVALVALAVAAALAAGGFALRARPHAAAITRPPVRAETPSRAASAGVPERVIVVDVEGAVRRAGLQRLPAGSRVADALAAAGGAKSQAAAAGLNLARKLIDGEQVVVGNAGPPARPPATASPQSGSPQSGSPQSAAAGFAPGQPLDLNAATVVDLDRLSGVGPVLAQRIIAWRDGHGGFTSVDQLREVEGIGDRKFAALRVQVTV